MNCAGSPGPWHAQLSASFDFLRHQPDSRELATEHGSWTRDGVAVLLRNGAARHKEPPLKSRHSHITGLEKAAARYVVGHQWPPSLVMPLQSDQPLPPLGLLTPGVPTPPFEKWFFFPVLSRHLQHLLHGHTCILVCLQVLSSILLIWLLILILTGLSKWLLVGGEKALMFTRATLPNYSFLSALGYSSPSCIQWTS